MIRNRVLPELKRGSRRSRGITLVEVIVIVVIVGLFVLIGLFALPRRRETARLSGCRRNLMQIGIALALYDDSEAQLPSVPVLGLEGMRCDSPLGALLDTLGLDDFRRLNDASEPPKRLGITPPKSGRIPGFFCESDPYATGGSIASPISYRAVAGDQPAGVNGAFAPGRKTRMAEIENGDGRGYTAAFSERLVGNQRHDDHASVNYYASTPIIDSTCPAMKSEAWLGDAGSSWSEVGWRSTLYNHALAPNAPESCIAGDQKTALMGASSGHLQGVNVLMFDGSVRTVTPTINSSIWKAMATTHGDAESPPPRTQEPR